MAFIPNSVKEYASLTVTANNTDWLGPIDVSGYKWFSLQLSGTFTATTLVQGSNDGTNYVNYQFFNQSTNPGTNVTSANVVGIFFGVVHTKWMKLRTSSYTSGTMQGNLQLYTTPPPVYTQNVNAQAAQSGTWTMQPGNTANTTPWLITPRGGTTGGHSLTRILSAATTNATSIKASAGQVYGWYLFNTSASTKFLKLYNKASAPTVGTDTPLMTIPIPSGSGANVEFTIGIPFATGIALAITGSIADSDTTAVALNDVVVNLLYR